MYASFPSGRTGQSADFSVKPFGCNTGLSAFWSIKPFGCPPNRGESAQWSIKPFGASTGAFQGNRLGSSPGPYVAPVRNTSRARPVYDFNSSSASYSIKPFGQYFAGNAERIASVGAPQVAPIVDTGLAAAGGIVGGIYGGPIGATAGSAVGSIAGGLLNSTGIFGSGIPSSVREQAANNPASSLANAQPIINLTNQVVGQIGSMQATVQGLKAAGQSPTASLYQMAINGLQLIQSLFTIFTYGSSSLPNYNPEGAIGNGANVQAQMAQVLPQLISALSSAGAPASLIASLKTIPTLSSITAISKAPAGSTGFAGVKGKAEAGVQAWLAKITSVITALQTQMAALPVTAGTIAGSTTTTSTIPTTTGGTTTGSVSAPNVTATQNPATGVITATDHITGATMQFGTLTTYQQALAYAAQSGTSLEASPYLLAPVTGGQVTISVNPTTGQVTTTNTATGQTIVYPSVASYNAAAGTSSVYGGLNTGSSYYHPLPTNSAGQTTGSGYYVSGAQGSGSGYGSSSGYPQPVPLPPAPVTTGPNYTLIAALGVGAWFFFFRNKGGQATVRHRHAHTQRYEMVPESQ